VRRLARCEDDYKAGQEAEVVYSDGAAYFAPFGTDDFAYEAEHLEVIGSVYEHPEHVAAAAGPSTSAAGPDRTAA
jgi:hypothetical protein